MTLDDLQRELTHSMDVDGVYDPATSERALLAAILNSAVVDIKKNGIANRQATQFFLNEKDDYIFSFRAICDFLSLDVKKVLTVVGLKR